MQQAALAVLTFGILLHVVAGLALGFRAFDDTYITWRYAQNLAHGHGFVYNVGERVLGTTTPLWTLVLALLAMVRLPLDTAGLWLSLGCNALSAVLIYRMVRRFLAPETTPPAASQATGLPPAVTAVAAALLFLSLFDFLTISRSGMETPFFVALALGALHELAHGRLISGAFLAALGTLTRPEGLLLLVATVAAGWVGRKELKPATLLWALAAAGLPLAAWGGFAVWYFGSPLPQSVAAKAHGARDPGLVRFSWTNLALFLTKGQFGDGIFTRTYLQLNFLLTAGSVLGGVTLLARWWQERSARTLLAAGLALFFPVAYTGGMAAANAFTWFPWYYGPIYPFLALLTAIGLAWGAGRLPQGARVGVLAAGLAVLVTGQVLAAARVKLPADHDYWVQGYLDVSAEIPREAGIAVAAPEIGAVGWQVWPAEVQDLVGLVTPHAVGKRPEEFVKASLPDYVVLRSDDGASLLRALQEEEWGRQSYRVAQRREDPNGGRAFYLFQRTMPSSTESGGSR